MPIVVYYKDMSYFINWPGMRETGSLEPKTDIPWTRTQVAALGVIVADYAGWSPTGIAVQIAALSAALLCAMLLTWTDHRWPQVQEAIIGVVFVIASSAAILVLAKNPHGSENLKDLLSGQILWVNPGRLPFDALFYGVILALWFGLRERLGRIGFYVLFGCAVT